MTERKQGHSPIVVAKGETLSQAIARVGTSQVERDFVKLLYAALAINDQLRIDVDHVEFEGSMNQVEHFRDLVNALHFQHAALCKRVDP